MSRYQAYPQYENCENRFITNLPRGWICSKFKYEVDYVEGPGILATDFQDEGVPLLRIQNVKGRYTSGNIKTYLNPQKVKVKWEHFKVLSGDLLISGSASTELVTEVTDEYSGAIPYTGLIRLRAKHNQSDIDYIRYFVQSELFKNQIDNLKTGSTIQHFGPIHLQQIVYPSPSDEEKKQIGTFLDHEATKIDTLIEKQKQLIKLLKEKHQAVISHAVTQGLNPEAPMKDSNVEWLGRVPVHWKVKKIKHFGKVVGGYAFKSGDFVESGYPVIKITNVSHLELNIEEQSFLPINFADEHEEYVVEPNSLVFAMTRPIISGGIKVAKMPLLDVMPLVNQRVGFLKIECNLLSDFILFSSISGSFIAQFTNNMTVTNQPNISGEGIESVSLPIPPEDELSTIVDFLSISEKKFQKLNAKALEQIQLLEERRAALISAAVTGKIDVRHFTLENEQPENNNKHKPEVTV